ncbi:probable alpha,alpha-trehalose-phosphate synthase [UDP-forming] 7 [Tanacetum coccineum]
MGVCGYDLQVAIYKIESEIGVNTQKINTKIRSQGYVPVLVVDSLISLTEKAAYYAVSEAVVVTPVWDGMNLIPYEYVVCRNRTKKSMIVNAYRGAKSRAILLPFLDTQPSENLISIIKQLCDDQKTRCIKARQLLMALILKGKSAMVWHYKNAGEFGKEQAKDMLEHLEKVLVNVPVAVEHGQDFVEIKPKGVNKGTTAIKIFELMAEVGKSLDFVLGIGDDTSDEDVFVAIHEAMQKGLVTDNGSVFSCTVGEKPSAAKYFVPEMELILPMLLKLALNNI